MKIVLTDTVIDGKRAVCISGHASSDEMLAAINSLIQGHIQSLMNIGCPRQIAVLQTTEKIAAMLAGGPHFADGSVIATTREDDTL